MPGDAPKQDRFGPGPISTEDTLQPKCDPTSSQIAGRDPLEMKQGASIKNDLAMAARAATSKRPPLGIGTQAELQRLP
jgi:hypothetical protein